MPIWAQVLVPILCFILGAVIGVIVTRALVKKELKDNPPINEKMIKAMYNSMGRTPSQAQINQTMRAVNEASKKTNKK